MRDKRIHRAGRERWGGALMFLVIALILATIALAALEVCVFWKLGEQDDRRQRRERRTRTPRKAKTPRAA